MATIYNTQLLKELQDAGKIQISRDRIPTELAEKIIPVMEVNPRLLRRSNIILDGSSPLTGATTIYTTPTDQDFYLTSAALAMQDDVASDNVVTYLNVIINGANRRILQIRKITLTATTNSQTISFPFPIKIDRNTAITIQNSFTVGASIKSGCITGYVDEQSKA